MRNFSRPYGLLFLSFSLLILISGAAAQDNSTAQGDQDAKQILTQLDNATWISDIDWNPENSSQIKVTIHSEIPKQVYIKEIPDMMGKQGRYNPGNDPVTLNPGKNVIYVPVNGRWKLGVTLEDSNDAIYYKRNRGFIPDPGRPAVPIAGTMAVAFLIFGLIWRRKRDERALRNNLKRKKRGDS